MNQTKRSDLNFSVVAISVGAGCALLVLLYVLVSTVGAQAGRRGHMLAVLALVLGILVHCAVGYVTGRTARAKRAPVNFHVIFVGALVMLLSLLVIALPHVGAKQRFSGELALMVRGINILLTIPAMWLGANWFKLAGLPPETDDFADAVEDTDESDQSDEEIETEEVEAQPTSLDPLVRPSE